MSRNSEWTELVKFNFNPPFPRISNQLGFPICIKDEEGGGATLGYLKEQQRIRIWNTCILQKSGDRISCVVSGERLGWFHDNIYWHLSHCISLCLKHWIIWDRGLCLLRSWRAISHVTNYLCQGRENEVPPLWVGSQSPLWKVNNRLGFF